MLSRLVTTDDTQYKDHHWQANANCVYHALPSVKIYQINWTAADAVCSRLIEPPQVEVAMIASILLRFCLGRARQPMQVLKDHPRDGAGEREG